MTRRSITRVGSVLTAVLVPVLLLGAALLGGCATAPAVSHPDLDLATPGAWTAGPDEANPPSESDVSPPVLADGWWRAFGDEQLDETVALALGGNFDLRAAVSRVNQALAQATIAGADRLPTLDAGMNGRRNRQNFIGFPIPGGGKKVLSTTSTNYASSLNLSWEIDLWGRLLAGEKAALADLQAAEADLYGARLSLAGQTVKAWLTTAEASQQLALSEATVESFRASSEQVRSRYDRGLRPALDVRLALSNLAEAEAVREQRRQQLDAAVRRLELLMGNYPGGRLALPEHLPPLPDPVPAGLPSELVFRRPDLAAAERRLAASRARVDEADAGLYPRLSLTSSGGTASEELKDLLDLDFRVWSLVGNLTQPIFQGGRLRANVDLSKSRSQEALMNYAGAVLSAYSEVETALAAETLLDERLARLDEAAIQARAAERLAGDRYRTGLEDYVTVLESQRRAFNTESNLLAARRQRLENRVDLILALGGGFQVSENRSGWCGPVARSDGGSTP